MELKHYWFYNGNGNTTFFSAGRVDLGAVLGLTSGALPFEMDSFAAFVGAFKGFVWFSGLSFSSVSLGWSLDASTPVEGGPT